MTDTIGGQIDLLFDIISTASSYVHGGKVKAIAVGSPKRSPALPDVPTFRESGIAGLKDYEAGGWYAIYAPRAWPELAASWAGGAAGRGRPRPQKRYADVGYEQWNGNARDVVNTAARERASGPPCSGRDALDCERRRDVRRFRWRRARRSSRSSSRATWCAKRAAPPEASPKDRLQNPELRRTGAL